MADSLKLMAAAKRQLRKEMAEHRAEYDKKKRVLLALLEICPDTEQDVDPVPELPTQAPARNGEAEPVGSTAGDRIASYLRSVGKATSGDLLRVLHPTKANTIRYALYHSKGRFVKNGSGWTLNPEHRANRSK